VRAERRSRIAPALLRILCLAGCALGLAFVVTLLASLASGSATAHAESRRADEATSAPALWADPGALSATATRRAIGNAPPPDSRLSAPTVVPERPLAPSEQNPPSPVPEGLPTATSPIGSMGAAGSGAPDTGPSIAQLAVITAAVLGVRWLSQRVRACGLSWRNAFLTSSIERPG
jgi:hypothetical protein